MSGSSLLVLLTAGQGASHLRRHLLEILLQTQISLRCGGRRTSAPPSARGRHSAHMRRCGNQNTITRPSTMRPLASRTMFARVFHDLEARELAFAPGSGTSALPPAPPGCATGSRFSPGAWSSCPYSSRRTVPSGTALSYEPGSGPTM